MKILLIDDDPVLHENLTAFFQDKCYPSSLASTGAAALIQAGMRMAGFNPLKPAKNKAQPPQPQMVDICQGTKIFGKHSSIVLTETIKNVFIREVKNTNADTWEMVISVDR